MIFVNLVGIDKTVALNSGIFSFAFCRCFVCVGSDVSNLDHVEGRSTRGHIAYSHNVVILRELRRIRAQ